LNPIPATPEGEALLRQAIGKTKLGIGCVGLGTMAMGFGLMALHAFELDPDTKSWGIGMIVVAYLVAGFFVVVGGLMLYALLVRLPRRNALLVHVVQHDPGRIRRVYRKTIKTEGYEKLPGGQHCVCVELADGTSWQLTLGVGPELADRVHGYIRSRAPHATGPG
jgi:hypothetical protein